MSLESLIAFNAVLIAALLSPGAAFLTSVRISVSAGRAAGMATGLGLATMAALWTTAALMGLEGLFALFPWAYTTLKIAGAFYLIWIAVQTWRHARTPLGDVSVPRGRAFLTGFLVNLGNPKSMLFAGAIIVVIFPQGLDPVHIALIVANHFVLELVFYTACAVLLSTGPARARYIAAKPVLDRIAAVALGGFGLKLLTGK
ncbi:LysE family transporter [Pseudosulfitobacter sp. DSM 107133]|uniref:LysE family translocator n=1 Tax=Pseudosulfitobacter sp. DSM 107133 TaxID=2883100 RepID=UPI000DF1D825|nr:LysE family transporter [Pseudosulfitobacter sp. DSM 107133]UOA27534.1 Threonine efflux protein [Pseudosulfitobacter sp. DSM 107133]